MNRNKKIAALVLALFLFSVFCVPVSAEEEKPSVAYMDLQGEIAAARRLIYMPGSDWSDESFGRLVEKYEAAEKVSEDPNSTDQDYIDAKENLAYARKHLEPFNDKSALSELLDWVDKSGLLNGAGHYTADTYQAFLDAYTRADLYGYQYKVPQEKIDKAVEELTAAIDGLRLMGDVNNDKEVTIMDVLEIQKYLVGAADLNPDALEAADTGRNGEIGVNDCLMIQKYIAKLIPGFAP